MRAILDASSDGLEPAAYHLDEIEALLGSEGSEEDVDARLDVLLTDGLLVLGRHLRAGNTDPKTGRPVWTAGKEEVDALVPGDASKAMAALRPRDPRYERLRDVRVLRAMPPDRHELSTPMPPGGE